MPTPPAAATTVLVANPGMDHYGSDLQMLESVRAFRDAGMRVVVVAPTDEGPLRARLEALGAETLRADYPVVTRALTRPLAAARLVPRAVLAHRRLRRVIDQVRPDVLYVNTVTLPWWLSAGRAARVPVLCHVHEAEPNTPLLVRWVMTSQLRLADTVVANSRITADSLVDVVGSLAHRTRLIYNGVEGPPPSYEPAPDTPATVVCVGRLSPRKSPHSALDAVAQLRGRGHDVRLVVCGSPVPGQEAYERELRERAARPDLDGAVEFPGYVSPVWPTLRRARVFLATSTAEPLGNAVVEAQLAGIPVVATAVEGHLETVLHEETGLLVPVGDVRAMADAVERLLEQPELADRLASTARARSTEHFSVAEYRRSVLSAVEALAVRGRG